MHSIYSQKTNDFLLEKLIRHTCIAIVTTEYVQGGKNIFWLQLDGRYRWTLESCIEIALGLLHQHNIVGHA